MSVTHAPPTHVQRPHVNPWLVAVIALAAALVALGVWVVVDQTRSSTTEGVASAEVSAMLDDYLVAFNSGDSAAFSSLYAANAVQEDRTFSPAVVTRGSEQIADRMAFFASGGMRLEATGPVIVLGDTVARTERIPGETGGYMVVYKLDANGKIAHQWVLPAD